MNLQNSLRCPKVSGLSTVQVAVFFAQTTTPANSSCLVDSSPPSGNPGLCLMVRWPLGCGDCPYPAAERADQCSGDVPVLFLQSLGPGEAYIPLVVGQSHPWSVKAAREAGRTLSLPGRHF